MAIMQLEYEIGPGPILLRWIHTVLRSPWTQAVFDLAQQAWRKGIFRRASGLYEVLEYKSTLELLDPKGKRARVTKLERVRYLQDNIIAYQDQAWGDGTILINYRCSPGVPVDRYRPGRKTIILISLRKVKRRGETDVFHMTWGMRDSFLRRAEQWEAHVGHRMRRLVLRVIFPSKRLPQRVFLVEETRQRSTLLTSQFQRRRADGRWLVFWETETPRLHETYALLWEW